MGFRLEQLIMGSLIFTLVVVVFGIGVIVDIGDNYDVPVDTSDELFNSRYDSLNSTYDTGVTMKNKTIDAETSGGDESWESMTKSSYSAMREGRNSFQMIGDVLNAIASKLGVDSRYVQAAMTVLAILISFFILYIIFRFKP